MFYKDIWEVKILRKIIKHAFKIDAQNFLNVFNYTAYLRQNVKMFKLSEEIFFIRISLYIFMLIRIKKSRIKYTL